MFSRGEFHLIQYHIRLSTAYFLFPFDWDAKTQKLQNTTSRTKYISSVISFFFACIYTTFLIVRLIPGYGYNPNILAEISVGAIAHLAYLIIFICHIFYHTSCFLYADEIILLYNQIVYWNRKHGK